MATKPTLANARFGETAGGSTVGANLTSPSSGLRDTGFQPSTPAVSGYVNTLLHELYLWAKYVDEGIIDGDLTVDNLHVLGDVDIDDDLNVDGDVQVDGNINIGGEIDITGDLKASRLYFTGTEVLTIPANAAADPQADHAMNTGGSWWVATGNPGPIVYPIVLPQGATIVGWTVRLNKGSGAEVNARLWRVTNTFTEDNMSLSAESTSSTGNLSLTAGSNPNVTIDTTSSYYLSVYPTANFDAGDKIGTALISYTMSEP